MFKCVCENFHSEQCTKNEVFRQEIFRKYEKIHRKNAGMLTFSKESINRNIDHHLEFSDANRTGNNIHLLDEGNRNQNDFIE